MSIVSIPYAGNVDLIKDYINDNGYSFQFLMQVMLGQSKVGFGCWRVSIPYAGNVVIASVNSDAFIYGFNSVQVM